MGTGLEGQTWVITGAAGRIGSAVRTGLAGLVRGLVLVDIAPVSEPSQAERVVAADIGDPAALREAFRGAQGVIHLAAIPDEADFHDLAEANIVGTWHVLEAARQAGVPRIVYASTGRTVGMYDVGTTVSPAMPMRPDGLYGVSKAAGEALCRVYADKFGMTVTCLRIGAFQELPVDDRQLSTWVSPADTVRAVIAGMTHEGPAFSVFFAVSANENGWFDLDAGRELGYHPVDNAREHNSGSPLTGGKLAGRMAEPGFTLDRQRPFQLKPSRPPTGSAPRSP